MGRLLGNGGGRAQRGRDEGCFEREIYHMDFLSTGFILRMRARED